MPVKFESFVKECIMSQGVSGAQVKGFNRMVVTEDGIKQSDDKQRGGMPSRRPSPFMSPNPQKVIWLFGYLVIFCFCSCLLDFDVQRFLCLLFLRLLRNVDGQHAVCHVGGNLRLLDIVRQ